MVLSTGSLGMGLNLGLNHFGQHLLGLGLAAYLGGFALHYAQRFAVGMEQRRNTSAVPLDWWQATQQVLAPIPAGLVWFWPRRESPKLPKAQPKDHSPSIQP